MNKCMPLSLLLFAIVLSSISVENVSAMGPDNIDNRYGHGGVYPRVGRHINVLPNHHSTIRFHNVPYHYNRGVWYHNSGPGFVVVAPPVGVIAPMLPPYYSTVWYRGIPYYYGNNTYYVWQPQRDGYMVVEPPTALVNQQPTLLSSELYVYPKLGQSKEQQSDDRFECHKWAVQETGYDPSKPQENISNKELSNQREKYQRAIKACLDGKGYSVR